MFATEYFVLSNYLNFKNNLWI